MVTVVLVGVGEGRARTDTLRVWVWETVWCAMGWVALLFAWVCSMCGWSVMAKVTCRVSFLCRHVVGSGGRLFMWVGVLSRYWR